MKQNIYFKVFFAAKPEELEKKMNSFLAATDDHMVEWKFKNDYYYAVIIVMKKMITEDFF